MSAVAPDGRKMLRLEVRNSQTPIEKKPSWIKTRAKMGPEYTELQGPGQARRACTRSARRPAVPTSTSAGRTARRRSSSAATSAPAAATSARSTPASPPRSTATSRAASPSRSRRWACGTRRSPASPATTSTTAAPGSTPRPSARSTRPIPGTGVELLIPDFNAEPEQLAEVFSSRPEVLAHNVETVPRIFKRIRPAFRYERSLDGDHPRPRGRPGHQVQPHPRHGRDARGGQRRRSTTCTTPAASSSPSPSTCARPRGTTRWTGGSSPRSSSSSPQEAEEIGFAGVMSGPLVRSSYRAGRLYRQAIEARDARAA